MPELNTMSVAEFVRLGFLQELNRQFLHRVGLSLSVTTDNNGVATGWGAIWDYRHDPEGIAYTAEMLNSPEFIDKAAMVATEMAQHAKHRVALLGSEVQQPGSVPPADGRCDD